MSAMVVDDTSKQIYPPTEVIHSYALPFIETQLSPGSLGPANLSISKVMTEADDGTIEARCVIRIERTGGEGWVKILVKAIDVHGLAGDGDGDGNGGGDTTSNNSKSSHVLLQIDTTNAAHIETSADCPTPPNAGSVDLYLLSTDSQTSKELFDTISQIMDDEDAEFGAGGAAGEGFDFASMMQGGYRNPVDHDGDESDEDNDDDDCVGEVVVFPKNNLISGEGADIGDGEAGFLVDDMITGE